MTQELKIVDKFEYGEIGKYEVIIYKLKNGKYTWEAGGIEDNDDLIYSGTQFNSEHDAKNDIMTDLDESDRLLKIYE